MGAENRREWHGQDGRGMEWERNERYLDRGAIMGLGEDAEAGISGEVWRRCRVRKLRLDPL